MKNNLRNILTLFASLFVICANALTLEECQKKAEANYPLIKQYQLIEKALNYDLSNASKSYLPNVTGTAQANWQNNVAQFPDGFSELTSKFGVELKGIKKTQYKVGVDVEQMIWDGGAVKSTQALARAASEVRTKEVESNLYAIRKRVNNLFFGILLLQEYARGNDELQKVLKSNLEVIEGSVKNGTMTESDADLVKAEILTAVQDRIAIDERIKAYSKMLSKFVGLDVNGEEIELPSEIVVESDKPLNRPELAYYERSKDYLISQKEDIKSSLMPQIGAFAQGYYGYPGYNMFEAMSSSKLTFNFMAGLRLRWNMGGLYRKKNNLAKIDNEINSIDVQREAFLFDTSIESSRIDAEIIAKKTIIKDDAKILSLRQSVCRASEAKLQNGVFTVNDLVRDIAAENNAMIKMATHKVELLQSMYDYKFLLNN